MVRVRAFSKTFYVGLRRKPSYAARDISLEVQPGEIFGFLGPNGAGKTTTIKALLGLIRPDQGELSLLGHAISDPAWRARVGYMPEHPTFYDYLTGHELVTWFARLSGVNRIDAEKEARALLERVGLSQAMNRRLRGYSKGMLQRTGLATALAGSPSLLILDEPMTGLDPIGRRDIRELIMSLKAEGKTVLYSTHILSDVEMTCDRVGIINKGASVRTGRLDEILGQTARGYQVVVSGLGPEALARAAAEQAEAEVREGKIEALFTERAAAWDFASHLVAAGGVLERFEPHRDTLEGIFMRSLATGEYKE
ncbi:MAG: ABC transporter ATP-binding protein [Myxococcales bacterium]|nr:ABC transporter ATP-binding protein [Myxococcales bacterium]MCB9646895.1 ABC transporter ATP-binding protein [Deltaproteobacteria bacterium]